MIAIAKAYIDKHAQRLQPPYRGYIQNTSHAAGLLCATSSTTLNYFKGQFPSGFVITLAVLNQLLPLAVEDTTEKLSNFSSSLPGLSL